MKIPILSSLHIPNFFKRSTESIDEIVSKKVSIELAKAEKKQQVSPIRFNPMYSLTPEGRQAEGGWKKSYPYGVNFKTIRELSDYYPIARACIEYRKSQITQLDWNISPVEISNETIENENNRKIMKEVRSFLKKPLGKSNTMNFTYFIKQIMEDLLVIDAVAIYRKRNRKGDVIGYLPVDASTIELILQSDGTLPDPPEFAYLQRIEGAEYTRLTTDELIYTMMNPRTYTAFGFSPLETLIIIVTTALKLQSFNLSFLTEGNVPEGFVTVPRDIASSRDQLSEWQNAWDAMLSGDPRFQRKLKFLPEGMKYEPTIKASDMNFERFEKWLLQNTCAVYGVSPTAIGFNFETNRSAGDTSFEAGKERGLFPTALFVKELMDRIIQEDLGYIDFEFTWSNINPTNRADEAKVVTSLVNGGLMAIDEWRLGEGLKPTGAKDPFIMTPIGPIFVKDLAKQSASGQMPILPYKPPVAAAGASDSAGNALGVPNVPPAAKEPNTKTPAKKVEEVESEEIVKELRRWRKAAINDLKAEKKPREFKTDLIDLRTKDIIFQSLQKANSREKIEMIFNPFISSSSQSDTSLLNLYDDIDLVLNEKGYSEITSRQAL